MNQRQDSRLVHLTHRAWRADIHRQSEKRVDSITTCEDSSHARRCQRNELFTHHLLHIAQEGCLTCSCTSCEEETTVGVSN